MIIPVAMNLKFKIFTFLWLIHSLSDFVYACSDDKNLSYDVFPYVFFIVWWVLIFLYSKRTIRLIKEGKTKILWVIIKGLIILFFIIELLYSIYVWENSILFCW